MTCSYRDGGRHPLFRNSQTSLAPLFILTTHHNQECNKVPLHTRPLSQSKLVFDHVLSRAYIQATDISMGVDHRLGGGNLWCIRLCERCLHLIAKSDWLLHEGVCNFNY